MEHDPTTIPSEPFRRPEYLTAREYALRVSPDIGVEIFRLIESPIAKESDPETLTESERFDFTFQRLAAVDHERSFKLYLAFGHNPEPELRELAAATMGHCISAIGRAADTADSETAIPLRQRATELIELWVALMVDPSDSVREDAYNGLYPSMTDGTLSPAACAHIASELIEVANGPYDRGRLPRPTFHLIEPHPER